MTDHTGPRWAVYYRATQGAFIPAPKVFVVETESMATAIKTVQVALAQREGGPFRICGCEPTDEWTTNPVLPPIAEPAAAP